MIHELTLLVHMDVVIVMGTVNVPQESLNVELEDLITAASAVMHMTATLMVYMPSAVKWK